MPSPHSRSGRIGFFAVDLVLAFPPWCPPWHDIERCLSWLGEAEIPVFVFTLINVNQRPKPNGASSLKDLRLLIELMSLVLADPRPDDQPWISAASGVARFLDENRGIFSAFDKLALQLRAIAAP